MNRLCRLCHLIFVFLGKASMINANQENKRNYFSQNQMESLTAICDTFIPSIIDETINNENLKTFYETSASQAGVPEVVAEYISSKFIHKIKGLLVLALWFLNTWFGTLILCGKIAFSCEFPFVRRFSKLSQEKREKIVYSWSQRKLLRMFFTSMKSFCCLAFYSKVNEKGENPAWKAIGYSGPDPSTPTQAKGPLHNKVIDLGTVADNQQALTLLGDNGCEVTNKNAEHITIKCDVVIVGSGSGGGVIAGVLAKAGLKVVVLEKGKYFARSDVSLNEGESLDQMYDGNGLIATDDAGMLMLAGSTVGGGSCVNWSASLRTPLTVMTEWKEKHQLSLFTSEKYANAMDAVCKRMSVSEDICPHEGFNNAVLRKGCEKLSYTVTNIPRNGAPDHYCGWCCFGCKNGKKQGTHETWLVDAVSSGSVILSSCEAVSVITEKNANSSSTKRKKATGVVFKTGLNGSVKVFVESVGTVVACGALRTPRLLKNSGLQNNNIGKNLHLHPVRMAWGYFPENKWPPKDMKSYEGGIMTAMCDDHGPTGYGTVIQTPSCHPGIFSVLMPWTSSLDMKQRMAKFSRTAHVFALARDKSSGTADFPGHISYSICKEDEYTLGIGVEKVLRILVAAGAEEVGTHHFSGDRMRVKGASSGEIEEFIKMASGRKVRDLTTPLCSAHQMGSCRMGKDEKCSVVDESGETWEVEGLFLGDGSVLPTAVGVNPMVTIKSVAFCTAQSVLSKFQTLYSNRARL